jgi:DNA-binding transcriptional regulator LsrR (DeoR family)
VIDKEKRDLVYKIARDYYQENRTQQEIANKYGISRIMVSRLLSRAVEEKIVEITDYVHMINNEQMYTI